MKEQYIAFYTTKPFWAGNPLDLKEPEISSNFTALMSKVEFSYHNNLFKFKVCKDGMLMIQIRNLEEKLSASKKPDIYSTVYWYSKYLNYANCLNLILDSSMLEVKKLGYLELFEITNKDTIGNKCALFFQIPRIRMMMNLSAVKTGR